MDNLRPFIKWAGGKEKELPYIKANLPANIDKYIEPFVGGGAVYFDMNIKKSFINDKSEELINLYKAIQNRDEKLYSCIDSIDKDWKKIEKYVDLKSFELKKIYKVYCSCNSIDELKKMVNNYISANRRTIYTWIAKIDFDKKEFTNEIFKNIVSKFSRMKKIESTKGCLSDEDLKDNIECSLKSAFYMYVRNLYNNHLKYEFDNSYYSGFFYFIREYCYAAMFRYNKDGEFNVPYGGISYNSKDFRKKIDYLFSDNMSNYLKSSKIYCQDFETFLNKMKLSSNDFVFVDPPYDTEFSTYAQNEFGRQDQIRLADCLSNLQSKVMIVIKNTDFIYDLYSKRGFNIKSFEKQYLVSFQNRNDKDAEHLIITNY